MHNELISPKVNHGLKIELGRTVGVGLSDYYTYVELLDVGSAKCTGGYPLHLHFLYTASPGSVSSSTYKGKIKLSFFYYH